MNARAYELMATMSGILDDLPGSTGFSFLAGKTWSLLLIAVSSDQAVFAVGKELGLKEAEITRDKGQWWRRATSDGKSGALRIMVRGPRHSHEPPPDDSQDRSA